MEKLFLILFSLFIVTMVSCNKTGIKTEQKSKAIINARQTADQIAAVELKRCETEHQKRDPRVSLPLKDYKVTFSEDDDNYHFFYEHNNINVDFELWEGHPMHFSIYISKKDGKTRLIGGE